MGCPAPWTLPDKSSAAAKLFINASAPTSAAARRFCVRLVFIALNFLIYRFLELSENRLVNTAFSSSSKSGRSNFRRRHRAEEYPQHLFFPDRAHQFVYRAVHNNQHEQNDLDSPEMRPHDFRQQLLIARNKAASLPPEIDKALQIVNERGHQQVDQGLPRDVVDQRFVGKAIDHRQQVRDQHCLAENESGHRNRHRRQWRNPGSLQHQHANKRDDMQSHEKKDRWWEQLKELLLERGG